jgi:hypothetical protein
MKDYKFLFCSLELVLRFFSSFLIARARFVTVGLGMGLQTAMGVEVWRWLFLLVHDYELVIGARFAHNLWKNLNLARLIGLNGAEVLGWIFGEAIAEFYASRIESFVKVSFVGLMLGV